jgi:hypothetical protein
MSNYKQIDGAFSKWIRSGLVVIKNTFGIGPEVIYGEQQITSFDSEVTVNNLKGISKGFDPTFEFPLYDSITGELKRTATELEFYEMGASHYLATAQLRDENSPLVATAAYPTFQV